MPLHVDFRGPVDFVMEALAEVYIPQLEPHGVTFVSAIEKADGLTESDRLRTEPDHPRRRVHKEVVARSGVSSGTVSHIRQELRASMTLDRAIPRPVCVPDACRDGGVEDLPPPNIAGKAGGPGRTRTCDNTVMSGAF